MRLSLKVMSGNRYLRSPALARAGAALSCLLIVGGPAAAEALQDALLRTYRGNPQLNADRARQRSVDENVPRALSAYRPNIAVTTEVGPSFQRSRPGTGSSFTTPVTLGATLDQNLYDGGRTAAAVRSAESGVLSGRATLRGVEQSVLLDAVTAYMNVLRDTATVELLTRNLEALTETLRIARKRYETGDTRRTDAAQAESRLARGRADLAMAESNLTASRAAYRQTIGIQPKGLVFPRPVEDLLPKSLTAAVRVALEGHPAVRSAIHAVDMAQSDVRVTAGELSPSIRLQGSLQQAFGQSQDDATGSLPISIGPQLTVPIYEGGEVYARIRQAKETLAQRRAELEATRDDVRQDMRAAWGALDAARAAVPAGETAVSANEIALAGVTRESLEGARTILEVLNAQQELLSARTNLVAARRNHVVTSYAALAALGVLTHGRLGLDTPRYRPETHYDQVRDLTRGLLVPDGR